MLHVLCIHLPAGVFVTVEDQPEVPSAAADSLDTSTSPPCEPDPISLLNGVDTCDQASPPPPIIQAAPIAPWHLHIDAQGGDLTLSDLSINGSIVGSWTEPLIKVSNVANVVIQDARMQGISGLGSSLLQLEPLAPLASVNITGCMCSNVQLQGAAVVQDAPAQPETGVCVDVHASTDARVSISVADSVFESVHGPGAALAVQVREQPRWRMPGAYGRIIFTLYPGMPRHAGLTEQVTAALPFKRAQQEGKAVCMHP